MHSFRARIVPFLPALLLAGCDCGTDVQVFDPSLDEPTADIDFGLVVVGETERSNLVLLALTNVDISLVAHIEEPDSAFAIDGAVPEFILGNGQVTIDLSFTPPAADTYAATLVIETNDPRPDRARVRILLSGQGKSPQIAVTPDHLDFSAIACPSAALSPRCKDVQQVVVKNAGLVDLTLDKLEIKSLTDGAAVPNLSFAELVNASRLGPGQELVVKLQWKPASGQAPGPLDAAFDAKLVVPSNDPGHPKIEVLLHAVAKPNSAPKACIRIEEVTRRSYRLNAQGAPEVYTQGVPSSEYLVDGEIRVRPNMTVKLASDGLDTEGNPCTTDPEGEALTYRWTTSARPTESRAEPSPATTAGTTIEIDAVGSYEVSLAVKDSLQLAGSATLVLNAIPRDDLFVQLSWQGDAGAQDVDLDLHLLADDGEAITGPASLFCIQDAFFQNPNPNVFGTPLLDDDPRFLRDDQGTKGQLESTTLLTAPAGSSFRVAVHYYATTAAVATSIQPTIKLRLRGQEFGPFAPTTALSAINDTWIGVKIDFPPGEGALPTATALQQHSTDEPAAVGVCL